tara:strand:+ start:95 stop:292 length:198 start_codon:yes stop_codon:yes gene_type:complete
MQINKQDKQDIISRVVDSLYEKLANELEYELQEHENNTETDDAYIDLFDEMTIDIVKEMKKQLFV